MGWGNPEPQVSVAASADVGGRVTERGGHLRRCRDGDQGFPADPDQVRNGHDLRACGASVYVCVSEGGRGEAQGREKRASRGCVCVWAAPGKTGERRPALKGAMLLWRVGR